MSRPATHPVHLAIYLDARHGRFNLWWQASFLLCGLLAVTLLLWWIDPRQLDGASVWAKPLKFELSLIIYSITLAVLAALLTPKARNAQPWIWASRFAVGAGLLEVGYIFIQAARGRRSHFNDSTAFEAAMYGLMGVGALVLVAVSCYLGYVLYRQQRSIAPTLLHTAAIWGLFLGSGLTLLTAGVMAGQPGHFVSPAAADFWRVPLLGWSLSGGDLRIPHFFATHLMQLLPLYGWWLQRRESTLLRAQFKLWAFTLVYCVAVVAWFATSFIAAGAASS